MFKVLVLHGAAVAASLTGSAVSAAADVAPAGPMSIERFVSIDNVCAWPNLTRLPYDENFMRICALLSRHPTSVMLATRILKIPAAEMNRFYCAAYYAGMVKVKNQRDPNLGPVSENPPLSEPQPAAPPKNAGLLGKLFKRLVGI